MLQLMVVRRLLIGQKMEQTDDDDVMEGLFRNWTMKVKGLGSVGLRRDDLTER